MVSVYGITIRRFFGGLGGVLTFWVTNSRRPAIYTLPTRANVDGFGAACSVTVPLPDPVSPDAMVTQVELLEALQAQFDIDVTETRATPPVFGTVTLVGVTLYVHGAAA